MTAEHETRIASLEAAVRRQRLCNALLVGTGLIAVAIGAARPESDVSFDVVRCHKLMITGDSGNSRIVASIGPDGGATIDWLDKSGKPRIIAGTAADGGAAVNCLDRESKPRLSVGTGSDGSASVALNDKEGKLRIDATTWPDGRVTLPTKDMKH